MKYNYLKLIVKYSTVLNVHVYLSWFATLILKPMICFLNANKQTNPCANTLKKSKFTEAQIFKNTYSNESKFTYQMKAPTSREAATKICQWTNHNIYTVNQNMLKENEVSTGGNWRHYMKIINDFHNRKKHLASLVKTHWPLCLFGKKNAIKPIDYSLSKFQHGSLIVCNSNYFYFSNPTLIITS